MKFNFGEPKSHSAQHDLDSIKPTDFNSDFQKDKTFSQPH